MNHDNRTPSAEQLAAIQSPEKAIIVSAGPGSGKTQTTVWRIIRDAATIHPLDMVVITFTNAGARELKARLPAYLKLGFVGTLHAYALRALSAKLPVGRNLTVIDEEVATGIMNEIAKQCRLKVAACEIRAQNLQPVASKRTPAGIVSTSYRRHLARIGAIDHDLILSGFLALLMEGHGPRPAALYVDEFQDSSLIDAQIYAHLRADAQCVWYVGDVDQSIFGFRGARPENMLELMASPLFAHRRLRDNYRSTPNIVEAANRLIKRNSTGIGGGRAVMWPNGLPLVVTEYASTAAEVASIAAKAAFKAKQLGELDRVAILCRYNAQIEPMRAALASEGVQAAAELPDASRALLRKLGAIAEFFANPSDGTAEVLAHTGGVLGAFADGVDLGKVWARLAALGIATGQAEGETLHRLGMDRAAISEARALAQGNSWPEIAARVREFTDPAPAAVFLGTMHAAKGRQWHTVYIAGMEDQRMPGGKLGDSLEAERRLFYVAVTRAEVELHLSWAKRCIDARGVQECIASRLIVELTGA